MGLWDSLMGRSRPKAPNLDSLFLVPSAAITLQTAAGLTPTGSGSVCYRAAAGAAFSQTQDDVIALLRDDPQAPPATLTQDPYGFTWLVVEGDPDDVAGLCTDLHAVNTSLAAQGFDGGLLCTLVPFQDQSGRRVGLVYLYKQGTFYPFAPVPGEKRRDNLLELSVRDQLAGELPMEKDLQRWLAVWDAPGL
ncbi:PspA-associated protein PspAB [Nocardioides campestrisoli]|uniref:PspA-associated protein PspAB n=1 Tax=Nocardioides campestrisoli TaxID=2736757 RepID=UPI0015E792CE